MGKGLSRLQCAILESLPAGNTFHHDEYGHAHIGHLPTTGDILEALGRNRTKANYAAVSKALRRLEERGLVVSFDTVIWNRGKGRRYATSAKPHSGAVLAPRNAQV